MPTTKRRTIAAPKVPAETATAQAKESKPAENKAAKKKFVSDSPILCRSVTQGATYMEGQNTHTIYRFDRYGAEAEVEYRDLVSEARISNSSFLYGPMIIVEDEDFIAEFPMLQKFYKEHYAVKDLRAILDLPVDEMTRAIESLPKGAKDQLKNIASAAVSNGSIDSMRKINTLNEVFKIDMRLVADIVNE